MISVILPSRLRLEPLLCSMASLLDTAGADVEFVIAVDPDDPTDYSPLSAKVWCAPVRFGYHNLHLYYNVLSRQAEGDWLFLWNDDAEMVTENWGRIVESYGPNVVLSPDSVHRPMCTFPIVPKRFVDAIGHFSLNAHCDSWWEMIARSLDILVWPPIRVEHHRADLTRENNDSVFRERRYQSAEFETPEMVAARARDAETIKGLLA